MLAWERFGWSASFLICCLFFALLLTLSVIDLNHRILPDILTLGGLLGGVLCSPFQDPGFFHWNVLSVGMLPFWDHLGLSFVGFVLGGGLLWSIAAVYRWISGIDGMGFGDVKMTAMVGAFLGWECAWLSVFLGALLGAAIGLIYIKIQSKGRRYHLPFGTFLGMAAVAVALGGPEFLRWYF